MRSEKGYTGVDIAISIVVITMFVGIIALLISRFNSNTGEMELKSQATDIAIQEIERVKAIGINATSEDETEIDGKEGFYKKIEITDYVQDGDTEKMQGIIKKATVTISYIYKNVEQKIELSTILEREL